ncbi:MAG: hypothetical protein H6632_15475 [Anaerolineales bacterium]|nr:hypothetical protein [Anaerolineales bacterium]
MTKRRLYQISIWLLLISILLVLSAAIYPNPASNMLLNSQFDAGLEGWQVVNTENASFQVLEQKPETRLLLQLSTGASENWIGIGQRVVVKPFQTYLISFDYRLMAPKYSSDKLILRITEFDRGGVPIQADEVSTSEALLADPLWSTFQYQFITDLASAEIEIGVAVLGVQNLSLELDNINLKPMPRWYNKIIHTPLSLLGVSLFALVTIVTTGTITWQQRYKLLDTVDKGIRTPMFGGLKNISQIFLGFWLSILAGNFLVRHILCEHVISFDCPYHWPVSMMNLRWPTIGNLLTAIGVLVLFVIFIQYFPRYRYGLAPIIAGGILLLMGSTLIQGWYNGFSWPIIEDHLHRGTQYYHDAMDFESVEDILTNFNERHLSLHKHTKTHPPGTLITFFTLERILHNINAISIAIGVISIVLSIFFLYRILVTEISRSSALYATLLFILIPSIQIYYIASIDALIAAFLLGFLYCYFQRNWLISFVGASISLFLASMLTFGVIFALPIVFGYDLLRWQFRKALGISIIVGLLYLWLYLVFDFNYWAAFFSASHTESIELSQGFLLLVSPISYVFTRIEGVLELILFFTPFLALLMIRGFKEPADGSRLIALSKLSLLTFALLFAAGVFRTGETARIGMFIYPYLFFPVAFYLSKLNLSFREENVLMFLVFMQTILMQLFGFYLW